MKFDELPRRCKFCNHLRAIVIHTDGNHEYDCGKYPMTNEICSGFDGQLPEAKSNDAAYQKWFWATAEDYKNRYICGNLLDNDMVRTNALIEIATCLHEMMQQSAEANGYLPPKEKRE